MRENRDAVLKGAEFLERWAVLTHVPEATAVVTDDVSGFRMVSIEAVFERESIEVSIVVGCFVANNKRELCRRDSLKVSSGSETASNRETCFLQSTERTSRRDVSAGKARGVNPC
jgi:hypothetical protein